MLNFLGIKGIKELKLLYIEKIEAFDGLSQILVEYFYKILVILLTLLKKEQSFNRVCVKYK